jgi:hypothetical protein
MYGERSRRAMLLVGRGPSCTDLAKILDWNFSERNYIECSVYIDQLCRAFGSPPYWCDFVIQPVEKSGGTVHNVILWYEPEDQEHVRYARVIQQGALEGWDEIAQQVICAYLLKVEKEARPKRQKPEPRLKPQRKRSLPRFSRR